MVGRVHWLLWNLSPQFKGKYILSYDYLFHRYFFYRRKGYKIYDTFTVIRTSKRCFRVTYCNLETKQFEYFSCRTSAETAKKMENICKG